MRERTIDWVSKYAATCDDATSLRHMRSFAIRGIAEFQRIRETIPGEQLRRDEWDLCMGDELIDDCIAQRICEARLAELGLTP